MAQFKRMLYVAAGSDRYDSRVLTHTAQLARENQAHLTIMDVVDEVGTNDPTLESLLKKMQTSIITDRIRELTHLAEQIDYPSIDICAEPGRDFIQVIRKVLRDNYDLVIKPVTDSRIEHILWGSLDLKLMRKCPCPVWLIKEGHRGHFKRILAAVDPTDPDTGLNQKIMDLASTVAALEDSELHVLHVIQTPSLTPFSDEVKNVIRQNSRTGFERLMNEYTAAGFNTHLLEGDPAAMILDFVEKSAVDLVVAGTVARTGISGLLMGNTAESILNSLRCSVVTLKPDGFVSPVSLTG